MELKQLIERDDDEAFQHAAEQARSELARRWEIDESWVRVLGRLGRRDERRVGATRVLTEGMIAAFANANARAMAAAAFALGLLGDASQERLLSDYFDRLSSSVQYDFNVASGTFAVALAVLRSRVLDRAALTAYVDGTDELLPQWGPCAYARWILAADLEGALRYAIEGKQSRGRAFALAALHDLGLSDATRSTLQSRCRELPALSLRYLAQLAVARPVEPLSPERHLVWQLVLATGLAGAKIDDEAFEAEFLLPALPISSVDPAALARHADVTDGERMIVRDYLVELLKGGDVASLEAFPWSTFDVTTLVTEEGTLLHTAVRAQRDVDHAEDARDAARVRAALVLLEHWTDVNVRGRDRSTPLHDVSRLATPGGLVLADAILKRGGDPRLRDDHRIRISRREMSKKGRSATELANGLVALRPGGVPERPEARRLHDMYLAAEQELGGG